MDDMLIEKKYIHTVLRIPLNENPPRPADTPPMDGMKFNPKAIIRL